jgi:hypothetical protein
MLGFFYAAECRQVLKSVKANFGIDILFTIAVHNNTNTKNTHHDNFKKLLKKRKSLQRFTIALQQAIQECSRNYQGIHYKRTSLRH